MKTVLPADGRVRSVGGRREDSPRVLNGGGGVVHGLPLKAGLEGFPAQGRKDGVTGSRESGRLKGEGGESPASWFPFFFLPLVPSPPMYTNSLSLSQQNQNHSASGATEIVLTFTHSATGGGKGADALPLFSRQPMRGSVESSTSQWRRRRSEPNKCKRWKPVTIITLERERRKKNLSKFHTPATGQRRRATRH